MTSYRRHRFPPVVIQHAIWLYLRFTLSYRDVEDLLAERGLDISYETVPSWVLKFGPVIAQRLRLRRPRPSDRWHLDEMVVRIAGKRMNLWRAVDHEGEVLDMLVQRRRDLAQLDDGNDRAILVQGDEGSAQVVRLGHRGTPSVTSSDEVAISSPPAP
jgi:transposase-like protein